MNKLRIGIAGMGGQGRKHLLNCIRVKEAEVIAVADLSKSALSKVNSLNINTYEDYKEMLNKEELDAVIISLPNHLHEDCCLLSSESGCDILVEKPLARNVDEAKRIASYVKKNGNKLMVGMNHRFIKGCRQLKKEIDGATFGHIDFASGLFYTGPFFQGKRVPSWFFDPNKTGGGVLLDAGCHLIDLFLWFFGDVNSTINLFPFFLT